MGIKISYYFPFFHFILGNRSCPQLCSLETWLSRIGVVHRGQGHFGWPADDVMIFLDFFIFFFLGVGEIIIFGNFFLGQNLILGRKKTKFRHVFWQFWAKFLQFLNIYLLKDEYARRVRRRRCVHCRVGSGNASLETSMRFSGNYGGFGPCFSSSFINLASQILAKIETKTGNFEFTNYKFRKFNLSCLFWPKN